MSRTLGATDRKKRKKRKFYAGKRIKRMFRKGKLVPYKSKRKRGDPIKLYFWSVEKMSKDGYSHWSRHLRPKVRKIVFKPLIRVDVPPERLCTRT